MEGPAVGLARELLVRSAPRSRDAHLIASDGVHQLFIVEGSRLFAVDADTAADFASSIASSDPDALRRRLDALDLACPPLIDDAPPAVPRVRALSLAIAQKCNLGCSYCYARGGEFGGAAKNMTVDTAARAVDLLLSEAAPRERVNLAFLGGEPLANRDVLHQTTRYAAERACVKNILLTFSITTNGTLVNARDI